MYLFVKAMCICQNNCLVVAMCYFTKWLEADTLESKTGAGVAWFLYKLHCRFGHPDVIISDQGSYLEYKNTIDIVSKN